jgi:hypothetical protein
MAISGAFLVQVQAVAGIALIIAGLVFLAEEVSNRMPD